VLPVADAAHVVAGQTGPVHDSECLAVADPDPDPELHWHRVANSWRTDSAVGAAVGAVGAVGVAGSHAADRGADPGVPGGEVIAGDGDGVAVESDAHTVHVLVHVLDHVPVVEGIPEHVADDHAEDGGGVAVAGDALVGLKGADCVRQTLDARAVVDTHSVD